MFIYVLQIVVWPFVLFLLVIVLSVLLRYTDSDYPFGIFKLFFNRDGQHFNQYHKTNNHLSYITLFVRFYVRLVFYSHVENTYMTIISLKWEVCAGKTSLSPHHPFFFIKVPVPCHESERSYISALMGTHLPFSTIFLQVFVTTVWYLFGFSFYCILSLVYFTTGFVTRLTRRVSLVEEELHTLPEHLSSSPVLVGFVLLDLQFYMYVLQIVVCSFVLFLLVIVLSVLRFTYSDCLPLVS